MEKENWGRTAELINVLSDFCGVRDIEKLTQENLIRKFGLRQADIMVLFGGCALCGGDVLAEAMREQVAKKTLIVGGEGHTTPAFRERIHALFPEIATEGKPEAELFDAYLRRRYGVSADYLECRSANCGENITFLLELLKEKGIVYQSILLCHDNSMQRRIDAVLRKYVPNTTTVINYAAYRAKAFVDGDSLAISEHGLGMWSVEHYVSLLLSEIPRLMDDADGYGPKGKGFMAHVEVPEKVARAFTELKNRFPGAIRQAR